MSCLVLAHDVAANPPARGHFQASCPGPGPYVSAIGRWATRATGPTATAATRHPPASLDERGKNLLKRGPVLFAEVDLVGYAVQAEPDPLGVPGAIKIVRDDHGHAFGHGTDGRPRREQLSTKRTTKMSTTWMSIPSGRLHAAAVTIPAGWSSADHPSEIGGLVLSAPPELYGIYQLRLRAGPCPMPAQTTPPVADSWRDADRLATARRSLSS